MKEKKLQFFETKPVSGNKPKNLVMFLHGYGSSGQDLIGLAPEFAKTLPDAQFISPNAPFSLENAYYPGYQWFSLSNYDPKIISPQIIKANDIVDEFVSEQLQRFSLNFDNLFYIGFSQGSMMAMYNSLRAKQKAAGVVAYSGKLILPTNLGESVNSKPPICLIHGTQDQVVPFDNMIEAKRVLNELGNPFEAHEIPGLQHSIDRKGIDLAKKFIAKTA
jgi:phospholipase/carboxylesterase